MTRVRFLLVIACIIVVPGYVLADMHDVDNTAQKEVSKRIMKQKIKEEVKASSDSQAIPTVPVSPDDLDQIYLKENQPTNEYDTNY